jgi:hypothetical protein
MIMGLDRPDAGQARIGGKSYGNLRWPLRQVGALPEAKAFHPGCTARAHLTALAASNAIGRLRVEEMLAITGIEKAADRRAAPRSPPRPGVRSCSPRRRRCSGPSRWRRGDLRLRGVLRRPGNAAGPGPARHARPARRAARGADGRRLPGAGRGHRPGHHVTYANEDTGINIYTGGNNALGGRQRQLR